jgi:galactitol-specific phosphotransferase system IIB component
LYLPTYASNNQVALYGSGIGGVGAFAANALVVIDDGYNGATGNVRIITSRNNGNYSWNFDKFGNITFPDHSVQTTAYPGPQDLSGYATTGSLQTLDANVGAYQTWANLNFGTGTSTYSNTDANALFTVTSIGVFKDIDVTSTPPITGQVLKWNGTQWAPGIDATTGGGGTDADTLDGQHGDYYLNYNNFSNVPDLSIYATTANLNSLSANVGSFYTWANLHFGTSTYSNSNVASYLTAQGIAAQLQSDYTQADTGNVTYIKNKPDLSVYATNTALQTLDANVGAYQIWSNANSASQASSITSLTANAATQDVWLSNLQSNVNSINANIGSYYTWANANVAGLYNSIQGANATIATFQANVGSFYTWANTNFGTSSYANSNVAAYLTNQGIAPQLQSDWNQASTGNVTYIKNKPDLTVYATVSQLTSNVNTINANIGGYYTWANANVAGLQGQITGANASIQTISANLGGFETWANLNYVTSTSQGLVVVSNVSYYPNVTATTSSGTFYPGLYNASSGNLATYTSNNISYQPSSGNLTLAGNIQANGGYFRTSATTAYIVNQTPTTVYIAGGATIGTYIGNASGVTQLYGNVQGSTNGFAIGYRDIPQLSFTGNTTISLADAGKHYYSTSSTNYTLTVANNATVSFSIGAAINIVNHGTGVITYLAGNSTSTSRTLASYGMATIQKVATDTWFAVGVGLA